MLPIHTFQRVKHKDVTFDKVCVTFVLHLIYNIILTLQPKNLIKL